MHAPYAAVTSPSAASNRFACRPRVRRRLRELTVAVDALEAEIADLVARVAPHLLTEPGFGPLTAAKLIGGDRRRPALHQRGQACPRRRR